MDMETRISGLPLDDRISATGFAFSLFATLERNFVCSREAAFQFSTKLRRAALREHSA